VGVAQLWCTFVRCVLLCSFCTEWAPPLVDAAAPDAPAQGRDDDSARPLSLPPLNLLASLHVR